MAFILGRHLPWGVDFWPQWSWGHSVHLRTQAASLFSVKLSHLIWKFHLMYKHHKYCWGLKVYKFLPSFTLCLYGLWTSCMQGLENFWVCWDFGIFWYVWTLKILCLYGLRNFGAWRDLEYLWYVRTLFSFWITVHGGLLSIVVYCPWRLTVHGGGILFCEQFFSSFLIL